MTLTFLTISRLCFLAYDTIKYSALAVQESDPESIDWTSQYQATVRITDSILRHCGYCFDNIAFAYNIARWQRLFYFNHDPLQLDLTLRKKLIASSAVFFAVSLTFLVIEATDNLQHDL